MSESKYPTKKQLHPKAYWIIELEDKGQDFLFFQLDKSGKILVAYPFQTDIYKGGWIPMNMVIVHKPLPIHHPPHINFSYLKYKVKSIRSRGTI